MVKSIEELQEKVIAGQIQWDAEVSIQEQGDLILFNYTSPYKRDWNYLETISRGLILNKRTGEIVARPFDKFWNWGQNNRKASGHIVQVTYKEDGSLGILYRDKGYKIATRGSFESKQAIWATQFFNQNWPDIAIPDELTLLFEIIYPGSRVVVDYQGREDLVLLAARNRFTGGYLPYYPDLVTLADEYGFSLVKATQFNNIGEIIATCGQIDHNQEGYVVEFSDGSRWKFKGDKYIELHRLITHLSFKQVLGAVESKAIDEYLSELPDEFLPQVQEWLDVIYLTFDKTLDQIDEFFEDAPKGSKKEFALWVNANCKHLSHYLFAKYDNKPYEHMIYKTEFRDD